MKRCYILALSLLFATACERNSYTLYSRRYHVSFTCDMAVSPYNQLSTPGRFISIRKIKSDNECKLHMVDSDGAKFDQELDARQDALFDLGLCGLIMGTPLFDNDSFSVWAFDLGCPECDQADVRLTFDQQGNASCTKCGGIWALNTDGVSTNGKKRPLFRYPVACNNGVLTVAN